MVEYIHPRVETKTTDNSIVSYTKSDNTSIFQAIFSEKGPANEIVKLSDPKEFVAMFGKLDFRKYGLGQYNAYKALTLGYTVHVLRLVPVSDPSMPEVQPGGISNIFIDIQTKKVDAVVTAQRSLGTIGTDLTLSADPANLGESILDPSGTWADNIVDYMTIGSSVYFYKWVSPNPSTDAEAKKISKTTKAYWINSSNLSTITLDDNVELVIKTADGTVIGTTTSTGTLNDSYSRYGFLFSSATDITTIETVYIWSKINQDETYVGSGLIQVVGIVEPVGAGSVFDVTGINPNSIVEFRTVNATNTWVAYRVFSKLPITTTKFYIEAISTAVATVNIDPAAFEVATSVQNIRAKITSIVTDTVKVDGNGDNYVVNATLGCNILNFSVAPVATNVIYFDFPGVAEHIAVRPVSISKHFESIKEMEDFIENPTGDNLITTTDDGFTRHIICGFSHYQSLASNNYGIRLTPYDRIDSEISGFRLYNFEVTETINNVTKVIEGPYLVSFDPNAYNSYTEQSYWIKSVVDKYITTFRSHFEDEVFHWENLLNDMIAYDVLPDEVLPGNIDYLFEQERNDSARTVSEQAYIAISNEEITNPSRGGISAEFPLIVESLLVRKSLQNNGTSVSAVYDGSSFLNLGSSGSLDGLASDGSALSKIALFQLKNELLIKAFGGLITNEIYNKKAVLIDFIFDAGYAFSVKQAIYDFVNNQDRMDCIYIADTGATDTYLDSINARKSQLLTFDSYRVGLFTQNVKIYDNNTKMTMKVNLPYMLMKTLWDVEHSLGGIHKSIAGETRGTISGYEKKSLSFDPTKLQKDELFKLNVNYVEKETDESSVLMAQRTSQYAKSALSNIPVVVLLLRLQRIVEKAVRKLQYESVDYIISQLPSIVESGASSYKQAGGISSLVVTAYQQGTDVIDELVRTRCEITFPNIAHTIIVEWVVNKNNSTISLELNAN